MSGMSGYGSTYRRSWRGARESDEVDGVSRTLAPDQLVGATSPGRGRGVLGLNCGGAGAEI